MKLRYSPTSPYVRKAVACAIYLDLLDQIELIPTDVWSSETDISRETPLSKIPVLSLSNEIGTLFDSHVICEYFASLVPEKQLLASEGDQRWLMLKLHALGDGICDAAVNLFLDLRRPEERQWEPWQHRQQEAIMRSCAWLEQNIEILDSGIHLGTITVAVALSYLNLRLDWLGWQEDNPILATWLERFEQYPCMVESRP